MTVSPSTKIATWRYWFRLSRDVYGGNRSFAPYTKTINTINTTFVTGEDDIARFDSRRYNDNPCCVMLN